MHYCSSYLFLYSLKFTLSMQRNIKSAPLAIKCQPPPEKELTAESIISPSSEVSELSSFYILCLLFSALKLKCLCN